jgi:hypothetical protein
VPKGDNAPQQLFSISSNGAHIHGTHVPSGGAVHSIIRVESALQISSRKHLGFMSKDGRWRHSGRREKE